MTIKHLVIMGGGPSGFITYGAAKYLSQINVWNVKNIKSLFATSIGTYIGLLLILNMDWEILDNYIINRPWEKIIDKYDLNDIISVITDKGIIPDDFILKTLKPIFLSKNLPLNISLKDFYNTNNIDFHLYTSNINGKYIEKIDLSHKTHPNLELITAIKMSTAFPILFKPIIIDNKCYIDGGILNNFPLEDCLINTKCDPNEILAFKNNYDNNYEKDYVTNDSTLFYFVYMFIKSLVRTSECSSKKKYDTVVNIVECDNDRVAYENWMNILVEKKNRIAYIDKGIEIGKAYYEKYKQEMKND